LADPQLLGTFRVQSVLEMESDIPKDRVVNSFVFTHQATVAPIEDAADALALAFEDFWNSVHSPGTVALRTLLAGFVKTFSIRVYFLEDTPPRVPEIRNLTVTSPTGTGLPQEVALVSSLVAGRNLPRMRGRFYLGPLASAAATGGASAAARPTTSAINALVGATSFLAAGIVVTGYSDLQLMVLSGTDAVAREVTGGWVDNEFDTQRRRGTEATDRTTWGSYTS
jgi:hypothetical protein